MIIVYLIGRFPPVYGGQTSVEIDINRELAKRGHTIYFITPKYDKTHAEYENYEGINVIRVNPPLKSSLSELNYVLNAFIKIRILKITPDIIIDLIPFGNSMVITRYFSKLWNVPIVCKPSQAGANEPLAAGKGKFGFILKKLFGTYSKFIAISPILLENFRRAGIPDNKIEFISNCVDTDLFAPVAKSVKYKLRQKLFSTLKGKIVIVVGNVSKRKRSHLAIEAWKIFKTNFLEPATLVFVGPVKSTGHPFDEKYVDELKSKIQQYGLADSVIFTDFQKNVHEYFQTSDISLFVSEREGLGMVVLESMSTEIPIVTVAIDKITDYILTNGKEGFITTDDPHEISERMITLLSNSEIGKVMGKNGRRTVLVRFSVNEVADLIENLYRNVIS
jgi:glycosyltransferase involved in cell wall biosynthesis